MSSKESKPHSPINRSPSKSGKHEKEWAKHELELFELYSNQQRTISSTQIKKLLAKLGYDEKSVETAAQAFKDMFGGNDAVTLDVFSTWLRKEYVKGVQVSEDDIKRVIGEINFIKSLEKKKTSDHDYGHNDKALKTFCRGGLTSFYRKVLWPLLIFHKPLDEKEAKERFQSMLERVFSNGTPPTHIPSKIIPTWGSELNWEKPDPFLTADQIRTTQIILCLLGEGHVDLQHCPYIVDLVSLFLKYHTPHQVFAILEEMIRRSSEDQFYFTSTRTQYTAFIKSFDPLIKAKLPQIHKKLVSLKIDAATIFQTWASRFFLNNVNTEAAFHLMDTFLIEGSKIFYRTGLGLFKFHSDDILKSTSQSQLEKLLLSSVSEEETTAIVRTGFEIRLQRKSLSTLRLKAETEKTSLDKSPSRTGVFHIPFFDETKSKTLTAQQCYELWAWLPDAQRIQNPVVKFCKSKDNTGDWGQLLSKTEAPMLLIVKDAFENVFGAFVNNSFGTKNDTGELAHSRCFVFVFVGSELKIFGGEKQQEESKEGKGSYVKDGYLYNSSKGMSLGDNLETAALAISYDLDVGTTDTTRSFANPPLLSFFPKNYKVTLPKSPSHKTEIDETDFITNERPITAPARDAEAQAVVDRHNTGPTILNFHISSIESWGFTH